jgi:hypothetical protein
MPGRGSQHHAESAFGYAQFVRAGGALRRFVFGITALPE